MSCSSAARKTSSGCANFADFAKGASGGRGEQRPAPEAGVVDARSAQCPHRRDERKAQGERQGGVEADDDERLSKVLAGSALCVECRIGDAQDFCGHRRIATDGLGDFRHLDVRIARKGDDFRRHARGAGKIHLSLEPVFEILRQHTIGNTSEAAERGFASLPVIGGASGSLKIRLKVRNTWSLSATCC